MRSTIRHTWPITLCSRFYGIVVVSLLVTATFFSSCATVPIQKSFASPEKLVAAMLTALSNDDVNTLSTLFGQQNEDLLHTGQPVEDRAERLRFLTLYRQSNKLETVGTDRVLLHVGHENWPFPIPIIRLDGFWRFDTDAGREEILARRIGRNELSIIQTCLAYVDAQREYALNDWDGDGLLAYAQKFASDPGRKNGLYWPANKGEPYSPLGPLFASAQAKGYAPAPSGGKPVPYHGYYYRILKSQGDDAPGKAYDYVVHDKMIGGFALVCYPARYGSTGIMTFMVNHDGVVFQKDLGVKTEQTAVELTTYNPDRTWMIVETAAIDQN